MRLPYTRLAPEVYQAMSAVGHTLATDSALEPVLLALVYLRASVVNGCSFCTGMHEAELRQHHEP